MGILKIHGARDVLLTVCSALRLRIHADPQRIAEMKTPRLGCERPAGEHDKLEFIYVFRIYQNYSLTHFQLE